MEYRTLGKTGINVSVIGVGAWQLGGPLMLDNKADGHPDPGRNEVIRLIRACGDMGINLVDTAEQYGDGESERRIGEALEGQRDKWVISSKFGARRGASGERVNDASPGSIISSLEGSLQRLGTDYIDIYLYHVPPKADWIAEGKVVLERLRKEGKIKCYGISTNNIHALELLQSQGALQVLQFSQSLLTHQEALLSLVKRNGLGTMVRGALAGGQLSGKYFRSPPAFRADDCRVNWLGGKDTTRFRAFEKHIPAGMTMVDLALRYLLDYPTTHTVLLGGKTIEDYRGAVKAVSMPPLDEGTREALKAVRKELVG